MVYVISKDGKPLMPCSNTICRLLLKEGKCKVIDKLIFTIKLKIDSNNYTQDITLGVDTGSANIGVAAVDDSNNVIYASNTVIRNDIKKKMDQRRSYRRNRRNRKTRYRQPRWRNRKNSIRKDRFSPTMLSKIRSHIREISFCCKILPISKLIIETASFDVQALKDPSTILDKSKYQKGINYGLANTKQYVLERDGRICRYCKATKTRLEVHHLIYRSNGGGDGEDNLITLCDKCHKDVHKGLIEIELKGKWKSKLNHATQMSSIKKQLMKYYDKAFETFGYETKERRYILGLEKDHHMDAIAIAGHIDIAINFKTNLLFRKKHVQKGDYQRTKGSRSNLRIPKGKIGGFKKFDTVMFNGKKYFIKGRRNSGYFELSEISMTPIKFKPMPKIKTIKRFKARKSCLTQVEIIQNTN